MPAQLCFGFEPLVAELAVEVSVVVSGVVRFDIRLLVGLRMRREDVIPCVEGLEGLGVGIFVPLSLVVKLILRVGGDFGEGNRLLWR